MELYVLRGTVNSTVYAMIKMGDMIFLLLHKQLSKQFYPFILNKSWITKSLPQYYVLLIRPSYWVLVDLVCKKYFFILICKFYFYTAVENIKDHWEFFIGVLYNISVCTVLYCLP